MNERSINLGSSVVPVGILVALVAQSIFIGRWSRGIEDEQEAVRSALAASQTVQIKQAADIEFLRQAIADERRDLLMLKDYTKGRIGHMIYHEYQSQ